MMSCVSTQLGSIFLTGLILIPCIMDVSSFDEDDLLKNVRWGNWWTVSQIYKKYPAESQAVKIPQSGDTVLHIAVANGHEYIVNRLVWFCREEALAIANERGDTPLHVAAQYGSPSICKNIANRNPNLIGTRNQDGETPLLVAVSRRRLGAFSRLYRICRKNKHEYAYCRRKNGDTILHSAISQEMFKMAFYIIKRHPKLVHMVNEDGMSPLHLLATKPSCFESGTYLFGLHKLIYHCISVSKRRISPDDDDDDDDDYDDDDDDAPTFSAYLYQKGYFSCILSLEDAIDRLEASRWEYHQRDEEAAMEQETEPSIFRNPCRGWTHTFCLFCAKCCFYLSMCIPMLIYGVHLLKYLITEYATARVRNVKQRCMWSGQVMRVLLSKNAYEQQGMRPSPETSTTDGCQHSADISSIATTQMETPLLLAAKNGVLEMVEAILRENSHATLDVNSEKKNIVMLAVENRHLPLYKVLHDDPNIRETIFGGVDKDGNSVLHIAAKLRKVNLQDCNTASAMPYRQPWHIPGAALQMHMEVKWYKFVKHSMPRDFFVRENDKHQTPGQIFRETHQKLIEDGREWLSKNAQSCSVVAALIATVAFATAANVPGGLNQNKGTPTLEHKPIFIIAAVASLVALCFSMTSVIMFLGILNSSFKHSDFRKDLPRKLLLGLTSLLVSIVSMLLSFFAGHYFVMKEELEHNATLVYALVCFPLILFVIVQFPLDSEIVWAILNKEPQQISK